VEPCLLDVVSIPLADDGPHRDIQPENRRILEGPWQPRGRARSEKVIRYCQTRGLILHNADRRIHVDQLRKVADEDRHSLCLIRATVTFYTDATRKGRKRVWASFAFDGNPYRIPVTDYKFEHDFPPYSTRKADCLLTLSLGLPYEGDNCYKFVAGVLEL